jgi:hypothetical protein
MPITFRCQSCQLEKPANYRLPEQKYCADPKCQRVRRRDYQKNRTQQETIYHQNQMACRAAWRRKRSLAQYQRAYRENHPDYVKQNRDKQRQRNQKRRAHAQSEPPPVIVKMNSCSSINSGTYLLTPCQVKPTAVIVKMNSCLVELALFQPDAPAPRLRTPDCK